MEKTINFPDLIQRYKCLQNGETELTVDEQVVNVGREIVLVDDQAIGQRKGVIGSFGNTKRRRGHRLRESRVWFFL